MFLKRRHNVPFQTLREPFIDLFIQFCGFQAALRVDLPNCYHLSHRCLTESIVNNKNTTRRYASVEIVFEWNVTGVRIQLRLHCHIWPKFTFVSLAMTVSCLSSHISRSLPKYTSAEKNTKIHYIWHTDSPQRQLSLAKVAKNQKSTSILWINIDAIPRSRKYLPNWWCTLQHSTWSSIIFDSRKHPIIIPQNLLYIISDFNSRLSKASHLRETRCVSCADFVSPRSDNCGQFSSCCRYRWKRTCLCRLAPTENGRRMLNAFGICFGLNTYGNMSCESKAHASWSICVTLCDFNFFFDSACFRTTLENTERDSKRTMLSLLCRLSGFISAESARK